jgi:5-methylcytosine-specific restriction endonuclease McrA
MSVRRLFRRLRSPRVLARLRSVWDLLTCPDVRIVFYPDGITADELEIDGVGDQRRPRFNTIARKDPCAYCGMPSETIDHIIPRGRGGLDRWDNLAGACRRCNHEKGSQSMLLFLAKREEIRRRLGRQQILRASVMERATANKARCQANADWVRTVAQR